MPATSATRPATAAMTISAPMQIKAIVHDGNFLCDPLLPGGVLVPVFDILVGRVVVSAVVIVTTVVTSGRDELLEVVAELVDEPGVVGAGVVEGGKEGVLVPLQVGNGR